MIAAEAPTRIAQATGLPVIGRQQIDCDVGAEPCDDVAGKKVGAE
jgi:hypothetical protein